MKGIILAGGRGSRLYPITLGIGEETVCLILGDNIFYGHHLPQVLHQCTSLEKGGIIFGYEVKDPERYGVIEFNEKTK